MSALCALIFQSSPTADAAGRGWVVAVIMIKANTHTRFSSSSFDSSFFWFFAEPMQQLVAIVIIDANHLSKAGGCVCFVGGRCSNLMITMLLTSSRIVGFYLFSFSLFLYLSIYTNTNYNDFCFWCFSAVLSCVFVVSASWVIGWSMQIPSSSCLLSSTESTLLSFSLCCIVVVVVAVVGIMASTDAPVMDSISDAVAASSHHAVLCLLLLFFTFCFVLFCVCLYFFILFFQFFLSLLALFFLLWFHIGTVVHVV